MEQSQVDGAGKAESGGSDDPLVNLRGVSKAYKVDNGEFVALKGINLEVGHGEFVTVIGKSGAGKSTLVNMITGIDRPTEGEVCVGGKAIHKLNEGQVARWRGENVGIVFQFFQLLPSLTVLENVMLPMDFCGKYTHRERYERGLHLLDLVGIKEHAHKLPNQVSGGQQQRVAIARALANDPGVIIADEPTGNLDSQTAEQVFGVFEELVARGKSVFLVTHDDDLSERASRVLTLSDGEITGKYFPNSRSAVDAHKVPLEPPVSVKEDSDGGGIFARWQDGLPGTRWRKVVRDLWQNKARTLLVVLAIAVGVFAFGSMFATRAVLLDNMRTGFEATNQATLRIGLEPFNESLVRTVSNFPDIQQVEARSSSQVQVWTGSTWALLDLVAVPDFEEMKINRITLEEGTLDPGRREIVFERESLPQIKGAAVGSKVLVELPDSTQEELKVVGVAHDFSAVPGSRMPIYTGYVSLNTLQFFGLSEEYNELLIVTDPELTTHADLEVAGEDISDLLERYGFRVDYVEIYEPGKHWAADFINALVLILAVLGTMSLGLSGFLVVNTITAILAQQKRQIGMMKAVGAVTGDVMGIYMSMAVAFGALSLLVALPVGVALSYATTLVLSSFLNFDIYSFHFPSWVFATQGSIAIVAPLAAAFVPILAGTRTTVREAVSDYGIKGGKGGWIDNLLLAIRGLPRPVMLSLRNTFQRKGRLALTLATLTIAGAIFISIINTRNALLGQFDKFMDLFGFDIQVSLNHPENINRLTREAKRIDGVEEVEGWGAASGTIMRPEGVSVQPVDSGFQHAHPGGRSGFAGDEGSIRGEESSEVGTSITILAPPVDTTFIKPDISQGRWLEEGDYGVIVLSTEVLRTEPYIKVGDRIEVDFGDKQRYLTVVGVINLVGMPFAYAPFDYVTRLEGTAGLSSVAMLGTSEDDPAFQEVVAREVEDHFQDIGIGVSQTNTIASLLGSMISQIDFLILLMLFMAGMLGVVGGLGLASTMSLSVLERTREIGVMRSVGASNRSIRSIFLTEGMIIGLMSVAMASLLSVPISYALGTALGNVFFQHPLDLVLKPGSFAAWLVIAMVISGVASLVPANQATQISVRESISYE